MNYQEFLESKKKVEETDGIDIELDALNPVLFDYQKAIVKKALKKKRFALFEACGKNIAAIRMGTSSK